MPQPSEGLQTAQPKAIWRVRQEASTGGGHAVIPVVVGNYNEWTRPEAAGSERVQCAGGNEHILPMSSERFHARLTAD
jgi:hypothetical protein